MRRLQTVLEKINDPRFVEKLIVTLLLAGLALLFVEVRFEHQAVLAKKWQAWIPLIYSGLMVLIGPFALFFWNRGGKMLLAVAFSLAPIIGGFGFWLHSKGDPWMAICNVVKVVCMVPGKIPLDVEGPPVLAPLALGGLGLIGLVICASGLSYEAKSK
ncbi:MAG: hypothetical protein HYX67_16685 [Candidatus Melainabacteria bacterium]|jgi:hypothetical protein|nr:hypothetical protein [Candidatus Melainabacteria bacterium]